MTVRQDTINSFKAYLLMKDEDNIWIENGFHLSDGPGYTYHLAQAIKEILTEEFNFTCYWMNSPIYGENDIKWLTFVHPSNKYKKIFLTIDKTHKATWGIEGSNKKHINTSMICYLMRVMYPKLRKVIK